MSRPPVLPAAELLSLVLSGDRAGVFSFEFVQRYLPGAPLVELVVAVAPGAGGGASLLISDQVAAVGQWFAGGVPDGDTLAQCARAVGAPVLCLTEVVKLSPVHIPKPWGQEIWYTGIEQRGQSGVTDGNSRIPLPWLLALGAERLLAEGVAEPNLLKILDPLPEEAFGDLYFELHQEKCEVYVVTAVADSAWPDGRGAIRYGFDPVLRSRYGDDKAFRAAFLQAVREYESVRRQIDRQIDDFRARDGVATNAPVSAQTLKAWLAEIPAAWQARELSARQAMDAFTHMVPLAIGDVVKVARLSPHALQHGVRTVEFQTPVYERKILSFGQKVLTQEHWDTEEAVRQMSLEAGQVEVLPVVASNELFTLEQVVAFDDFRVYRLTLVPGGECVLAAVDSYKVVMVVQGEVTLGRQTLAAEEAGLVLRTVANCRVTNSGAGDAVCLVSVPAGIPLPLVAGGDAQG